MLGVHVSLDTQNKQDLAALPVAVIGAGPVGLAAAAHLIARGIEPVVFEAGSRVGASVLEWGHVRVFSPWEFNVDPIAGELLAAAPQLASGRGRAPRDRQAA
jgi:NADPH-dependent 2,4-dienoyl-CoA reductase/sulfur reductase-like enzyme